MANYIKKKNGTIIIPDSSVLTESDIKDLQLYRSLGYDIKITRETTKEKKEGHSKVEILYYLEQQEDNEILVDTFINKIESGKKYNFMAGYRWFLDWFKNKNSKKDSKGNITEEVKYNGEAAALIKDNGEAAAKRIKELEAIEEEKRKARAAKRKKNKK